MSGLQEIDEAKCNDRGASDGPHDESGIGDRASLPTGILKSATNAGITSLLTKN